VNDIELLFDYASPYAFLANELIATQLPGATIHYRPVYLRGFETFAKGIPYTADRLRYIVVDVQRCANEHGITFRPPASFPVNGLYALRAAIAAQRAGVFERYHTPMFRAVWSRGREASTKDGVIELLGELGLSELVGSLDDPAIKDELRTATESAIKRGVFGVPTFFVGSAMYWGHDRIHQVARALLV
jgi:2-hydroxychromene-2-carboxylate isomerase